MSGADVGSHPGCAHRGAEKKPQKLLGPAGDARHNQRGSWSQ